MSGDECEHDDQDEVENHGDAEAPGEDDNPGLVIHRGASPAVCFRRALGGDETHGDAKA